MSYQARNANRAKAHFADTPRWEVDRDTERGPVHQHKDGPLGFSTVDVLQRFCEINSIQLEYASEYGEPGYTTPVKGILFSNWNNVPKALQDRLEKQGYDLEWSDEWYVESGNSPSKAWRTESDSMGWEPRVRALDGDMITPDSDPQEWIDSSLNEDIPLPSWFDTKELETRGFAKMHDGQNDECVPALQKEGYDVILRRGRSQVFYEVWTRREAKRELFLSDARGAYIPRDFAQGVIRASVTGVDGHDWLILEAGPDHELYWDVWDEIVNGSTVTLTATDGTVYHLEQDGDLWLVEQGAEFCEHDDTYYVHKE